MGIGTCRQRAVALVGAVVVLTSAYAAHTDFIDSLPGRSRGWIGRLARSRSAQELRPTCACRRPRRAARCRTAGSLRCGREIAGCPAHAALARKPKLEEKQVEAALGHASTTRIEYQSNGGVVLWVGQVHGSRSKCHGHGHGQPLRGFGTDNPPHQPPRASRAPVAATASTTANGHDHGHGHGTVTGSVVLA